MGISRLKLAIGLGEILVRIVVIGYAHVGGIPFNFTLSADGEVAEQHHLGERTGIVKVGTGSAFAFAGH